MEINNINVGTEISVNHSRKGVLNGKVITNNQDSEWMELELYNRVEGKALGNIWNAGEKLQVRKSLLYNCELLEKN